MPQIPVPPFGRPSAQGVHLTPWCLASEMERQAVGRDHFGVYFLADKAAALTAGNADPLDPDIVYIGKASKGDQYMNRRAYEFREKRRRDGQIAIPRLYLAYCPVEEAAELQSHTVTMVLERLFIHNWALLYGRLPRFNYD